MRGSRTKEGEETMSILNSEFVARDPAKGERPVIVCLCGSSRFKDAFVEANRSETLAGRIVLSIGMFGHHEGLDMNGPVKKMLDELHFHKVMLADEVLVLNVGGYVGESTRREINHAESLGKPIRYLEP